MSLDLSRFHATFFAESLEGLDRVESDLLEIEQSGASRERMDAIFRVVHSLKGSAGSLGFGVIAELAHEMESVLDRIRQGAAELTPECNNLVLRGVDCLRLWIRDAEAKKALDEAAGAGLIRELQLTLRGSGAAAARGAAAAARGKERTNYVVVFRPAQDFFHSGNDPARFLEELSRLGDMSCVADISALPEADVYVPATSYLAWRVTLASTSSADDIREVFEWVSNCCALEIEEVRALAVESEAAGGDGRTAGESAAAARREAGLTTMHVRTEKIDELVNLVGELVITHTMLRQSARGMDAIKDAHSVSVLAQLERNVRDIQERVLAIRMMPVSHVFGRFPRLVRDLGLQLGKAIELRISGEQAELDKTVIEQLVDPLTHLVRNALDHGIELPADRMAGGKPAKGALSLHAEHRGGRFVITVKDDGRGINPEMVKRRALDIGLMRAGDPFDEQVMYGLLLKPGFSTAQKVSNLSGRGVGLDVVSENVRKLGGSLEIQSVLGRGTTFTINLPLTLAIVDGMIVGAGGERHVIPIAFIRECLQLSEVNIHSVAGEGRVLRLRGDYIPVVRLTHLCPMPDAADAGRLVQPVLVVLEADGRVIALEVDELLGQDQVVFKSLEANFRKVDYMAGASILGDGRVALILDINQIVKQHANLKSQPRAA
jgi:two-component system chemotaxis sensor kinase CheA